MPQNFKASAFIIGIFIFAGLASLGYLLRCAAIEYKQFDRSVTVKGLSEREFDADIVIWPLQFTTPGNDVAALYTAMDASTAKIKEFLQKKGISADEITLATPTITDKVAQQYGDSSKPEFRYTAVQTVTVYSKNVNAVRAVMGELSELGKAGIIFTGDMYQTKGEYLFTRLNDVKPEMIEEATKKAREVAEKFATDSVSHLGKIKSASQGQFSISQRDNNNPHIKNVRVVSTVEYYLSD